MHRLFAKINLLLLLFSLDAAAMDPGPSNWHLLSKDCFFHLPIAVLSTCTETCKSWCIILSNEDFWKYLWENRGQNSKIVNNLTYKQNCELCLSVNDVVSREGRITPNQNRIKKVFTSFKKHEYNVGYFDVWSSLEIPLTQNPHMLGTCYPYQESQVELDRVLIDYFFQFLKRTFDGDVLVVMPVVGEPLKKLAGRNLHDEFPNVLWIQCSSLGSSFLALVDVGVTLKTFSDHYNDLDFTPFFQFVGHLRSLRPDISAKKIRLLIKETSIQGVVDCEAAEKAVKECDF